MSDDRQREQGEEAAPEEAPPPTGLEIAATIVSALLVLGVLTVLVWDAVHPNRPATFAVNIDSTKVDAHALRAHLTVRNVGDDAAKSVDVHVALVRPETTLAESDLTIDWIPGNSRKQAVAYFPSGNARGARIVAEVHGYDVP